MYFVYGVSRFVLANSLVIHVKSLGDRRQELVFIGQFGKDNGSSRKALEEILDSCLLTSQEMKEYEEVAPKGDDALRALFFPPQ